MAPKTDKGKNKAQAPKAASTSQTQAPAAVPTSLLQTQLAATYEARLNQCAWRIQCALYSFSMRAKKAGRADDVTELRLKYENGLTLELVSLLI